MQGPVKFSIVIPTYNRELLVTSTINSLLVQSYPHMEIIVVDDGSTDGTAGSIKAIDDNRVKYFRKENGERGAARNFGASMASGDYINYFDSDDIAYADHLLIASKLIVSNNYPEVAHLGYDIKDEHGKLLDKVNWFNGNTINYAIKKKRIATMSLFIRKDVALDFPFSEDRKFVMGEDALLVCQLAARFKFFYDNTITSSVIQHQARSMSNSNELTLIYCRDKILSELEKDDVFMRSYKKYVPDIASEYDCMLWADQLSLHNNRGAWRYFKKYIQLQPANIFSTRTLIFLKNYFRNLFSRR